MRCGALLLCLLASISLAACAEDVGTLSHAGAGRRLLQRIKVTVGYSASATYRVAAGRDALPEFNKAADALAKAKGGTLQIEAGTYTLSNQFILKSNDTSMLGAGINKTVLKLKDNADAFRYAGFIRGPVKMDSNPSFRMINIALRDFTIDGNRAKQSAIATGQKGKGYGRFCFYMDAFKNLEITRMRARNCQGYGWDPHGVKTLDGRTVKPPVIFSQNITIQDSESLNNGWDGFTIDQILGGRIRRNFAKGNGRHAFNVVTGTKDMIVENNRAEDTGFGPEDGREKSGKGCAYVVNDNFALKTTRVTVRNNVGLRSNRAGLCLLGAKDVTISGNTFNGARYCGHFTDGEGDVARVTFRDNKCTGMRDGLIFVGDGVKLSDLTLSNNGK